MFEEARYENTTGGFISASATSLELGSGEGYHRTVLFGTMYKLCCGKHEEPPIGSQLDWRCRKPSGIAGFYKNRYYNFGV